MKREIVGDWESAGRFPVHENDEAREHSVKSAFRQACNPFSCPCGYLVAALVVTDLILED
jgi:hypothetical protein